MRKIQLDLSNLRVESFATASRAKERGTIAGHQWTVTGHEWTDTGVYCQNTDACTGIDSCSGPVDCICGSAKNC